MSPGPGPSCLPVHPPHLCALHPEKGSEKKKKEPRRQDAHRFLRAPCCLDWLLSRHPNPRLNPGLGHKQQSERPRSLVIVARPRDSSRAAREPVGPNGGPSVVWDCQGKKQQNKSNVEKQKLFPVLSISCPLSVCICALTSRGPPLSAVLILRPLKTSPGPPRRCPPGHPVPDAWMCYPFRPFPGPAQTSV